MDPRKLLNGTGVSRKLPLTTGLKKRRGTSPVQEEITDGGTTRR